MKWEMRCETCIHFDACKFIMERYTSDTLNEDGVACSNYRPKKFGKWIKNTDHGGWHCSICTADNFYAYSEYDGDYELQDFYCPHCGTDMRGEKE